MNLDNTFPANTVGMRGDMIYVINNGLNADDWKQGRPAIVVSSDVFNKNSTYIEVVYLTSQPKRLMPTHVSVMCRVQSTACCENIYTVPKDRMGTLIRRCSSEEMRRIDQALICSLGLSRHGENTEKSMGGVNSEPSQLEAELNVYKRLYNELLQKLLKT